jgi:hypothetical protein
MHAFMAGVREMAPDCRFQVALIGSWFDPPKAKETAFAQIDNCADIMYAERFGVSDAAPRPARTARSTMGPHVSLPTTVPRRGPPSGLNASARYGLSRDLN